MKKILPPTYFLIFLLLLIGLHFVISISRVVFSPYRWIGIFFIISGIVINLRTDNLFKKEKTTVKPNEEPNTLITYGPFRFSRHPMYLGMAAIILGASIFLSSLITFIFPIIFIVLMQRLFIPVEEKNLEAVFGQVYLDYKNKVRCWF